MKTVYSPGSPKGDTSLRFQFGGHFYELPQGESQWEDDIAGHLQRKYRYMGVRVVPSQEEAAAAAEQQAAVIAARLAKRPRTPAEAKQLRRIAKDAAEGRRTRFGDASKTGVVVTKPESAPVVEPVSAPAEQVAPVEAPAVAPPEVVPAPVVEPVSAPAEVQPHHGPEKDKTNADPASPEPS